MNHCLWKRHELWHQNWSGNLSQWLLMFRTPSQAITDLRLFHCIPSYANFIGNTFKKILHEPQPAIITTTYPLHKMISSGNWALHFALFSLSACKQLATAGARAYWHDCSSSSSWGGKTLKTNCFSSVVTKSCDPLHTVFQSHMLNQGRTDYQQWRRRWQLEVSPKINLRKQAQLESDKRSQGAWNL